ncbi:MAG TPA: hypothetical protein IAC49_01075, partial [Candidatus Ventricola intestinavium]|nr:hypothetical protein [Candidatus Ventricola intestinavium]
LKFLKLSFVKELQKLHKFLADFFFHWDSLLSFSVVSGHENAGLPQKRRKKAHSIQPRALCLLKDGVTRPTAHPAPDVLGDRPQGYWDDRPRRSPPHDFLAMDRAHPAHPCLQYPLLPALSTGN